MKRAAFLFALLIAGFNAACSGGSSTPPPPPPPLGFSASSLKGQYAFVMTGQSGADGFLIARIGTFNADGNGNIQGGTELVSTATLGLQQLNFSPGTTYTVSSDGRGVINFLNSSGNTIFSITMTSVSSGFISETDNLSSASGTFELQDSSAFTANAMSGSYVFDNSGFDPGGAPDSIVGQIAINSGVVQSGVFDENDNATASGPVSFSGGSLAFSDTTNGLGTLTFNNNNFQYAFVAVNSKKFHMIEIPGTGSSLPITVGTANAQTAPPTTNASFTGGFVLITAGVGTNSPDFKNARFTTDGNGGLTSSSIALDEKQLDSSIAQVPKGTLSAATYAIDTNFPGSGRGTATFKDSSLGTYSFVFYMSSPTQGVIQDNSAGLVADGTILAQTGSPFTNGSLAGDFAFNWSGTDDSNTINAPAEEDYVGHVTLTSAASGNVSGAMNFSDFNSNQGSVQGSTLGGTLMISGDGTNSSGSRSTYQVNATNPNGGPSTTFTFTLYPVNANTLFVVSQDKHHVTGGTFTRQVTPP